MADIKRIAKLEKELKEVNGKLSKAGQVIANLKKCIVMNNKDMNICAEVLDTMQMAIMQFMIDTCEKTGLDIDDYFDMEGMEEEESGGLEPAEASVELYLEKDLPSVYTEDEIMSEMFPEDDEETIF